MRFEGMLLVVKDMEKSKRFYRELLSQEIVNDLVTYVVFKGFSLITEGQWTALSEPNVLAYAYGGNVCQLGLEETDLDAFLEHCKRFPDVEIVCPLKEYEWGQRSIRFSDPDRHIVEVGEDMKTVTKRFLKSGMSFEDTLKKVMFPRPFVEMCQKELEAERC